MAEVERQGAFGVEGIQSEEEDGTDEGGVIWRWWDDAEAAGGDGLSGFSRRERVWWSGWMGGACSTFSIS